MPASSPLDLEGRLNGQREVLAVIVAHLLEQSGNDFARRIEELLGIADHQEDPGAVPDSAFAIEAASALEVRLLIEHAKAKQAGRR